MGNSNTQKFSNHKIRKRDVDVKQICKVFKEQLELNRLVMKPRFMKDNSVIQCYYSINFVRLGNGLKLKNQKFVIAT